MVLVGNHHPSSSHILSIKKKRKRKQNKKKPLNNISKTHMSRKIEKRNT
jgi:hypothetical protein